MSFSEYNQTRYFINNTLTRYAYSGVFCESSSYKPKEFNKLWVKSFTGSNPFTLGVNETSKNYTASVTLKCYSSYCQLYDFLDNLWSDCSNTSPKHDSIGIKASFTITLYTKTTNIPICVSPNIPQATEHILARNHNFQVPVTAIPILMLHLCLLRQTQNQTS